MSAPDIRELLSPMADRKVEPDGPGYSVDRQRVMASIAQAREAERRQQRWQRALPWAAAAAIVLAAGGLLSLQRGGSNRELVVTVAEGSALSLSSKGREKLTKTAQIPASGQLETAEGSKASVRAEGGVSIELQAQTRVGLDELQTDNRRLQLLQGAVRCSVPHQRGAQPFQVVTPNATIVDIGTVFTVSVEGAEQATRVAVQEGEVMVRHAGGEVRVHAPGSWVSTITAATLAPSVAAPEPDVAVPPPAPPPSLAPLPRRPAAPREGATLEEEALLLRQGLAAERQGHFSEARAALSTLLRKYPKSSVAADARAALERVEAREKR